MQTVPLSRSVSYEPENIERGTEAAIAGEIAERLLEYKEEISAARAMMFMQKLYALSVVSPMGVWFVLRLLSGDFSEITRPYSEIGKEGARSKQAAHQEFGRMLDAVEKHYPELAICIAQIRHSNKLYEIKSHDGKV